MKLFFINIFLLLGIQANAQIWLTDLEDAKKTAVEKNRNIILVFQGTDWCAPCIKLQKEIWNSEEFKEYAKDHFVLLKAEFPRKKKNQLTKEQQEKNNKLAEMYNKKGYFPLVVVLDKNGNVLGNTGYKRVTPSEYINILTSFE
ncbi:MAG: thioredoxin family protein [Chlorobi bacterium]|nr:thioredoxin family protein [Chlorobiota bacterium]